jgi:hypothetical protein
VHETYRMLGKEHEADLEREARRRDLAASARPDGARSPVVPSRRFHFSRLWVRGLAFGVGLRRSGGV